MKTKMLAAGLLSVCAILAGGSFIRAHAETMNSAFHVHAEGSTPTVNGIATCTGNGSNSGNAQALFPQVFVQYKANGTGTLQVLGGAFCCDTTFSHCVGPAYAGGTLLAGVATSREWTSSRSWVQKGVCGGNFPLAASGRCVVADK